MLSRVAEEEIILIDESRESSKASAKAYGQQQTQFRAEDEIATVKESIDQPDKETTCHIHHESAPRENGSGYERLNPVAAEEPTGTPQTTADEDSQNINPTHSFN